MNYQPNLSVANRGVTPPLQDILVNEEAPMLILSILRRRSIDDFRNRRVENPAAKTQHVGNEWPGN